jgi:hypothetical protein
VRVLLTGTTPRHIGRRVKLGYAVIADYLKLALEEAGCTVDLRAVVPGERLGERGYDAVVIGLSPPKGNPARYLYGALWAMMNARECGGRLVFYVDDWQYNKVLREAQSQLKDLSTMFDAHKRTCRASMDEALSVREWLEAGLGALAEHRWPTTIYPGWRWGDETIAGRWLPSRELVTFDPTAWALPQAEADAPPVSADVDRERRWVLSSLMNQDAWLRRQAISWPESEVREAYARSWGVLAPEYADAGSGWWRVRVVNTCVARAVLLGGREEMRAMGEEWVEARGPVVEEMSVGALRELADAQWVSVRRWMTPADEGAARLREAVERSTI